jgi:hypothetical protein
MAGKRWPTFPQGSRFGLTVNGHSPWPRRRMAPGLAIAPVAVRTHARVFTGDRFARSTQLSGIDPVVSKVPVQADRLARPGRPGRQAEEVAFAGCRAGAATLPSPRPWGISAARRRGRAAEGGGLLNRYTLQRRIEGSNPSVSASRSHTAKLSGGAAAGLLSAISQSDGTLPVTSRRRVSACPIP